MDDVSWSLSELTYLLDWRCRRVLEVLEQREGAATQSVLLDETDFTRGELYHILSELGSVGLASRDHHGEGPGEVDIRLTEAGREALAAGLLEELGEGPPRYNAWRELYQRTKWLDGVVHR